MKKIIIWTLILAETLMLVSCDKSDKALSSKSKTAFDSSLNDFSSVIDEDESANSFLYTDKNLNFVISAEDYKNGSLDDRVKLLQPVLEQLLDEGYISSYKFDLEGERPNVCFKYIEGGSGTVVLTELPQNQN